MPSNFGKIGKVKSLVVTPMIQLRVHAWSLVLGEASYDRQRPFLIHHSRALMTQADLHQDIHCLIN